jgi:DNA topoisomerase-1
MGDGEVVALDAQNGTVDVRLDSDGKTYRAKAAIVDDIDVDREAQDAPEGSTDPIRPSEAQDIPDGMRRATLEEIRGLKIPPAYRDPLVPQTPGGDLLWTARDRKGRLKSKYDSRAERRQAAIKFERIRRLEESYDDLTATLMRDAESDDNALAALLMSVMAFRPGSTKDTKADTQAYGATTLEDRHLRLEDDGMSVSFDFIGKEGIRQVHTLQVTPDDANEPEGVLARLLRERKSSGTLESAPLFDTTADDVNDYLRDATNDVATSKDLRTRLATAYAARLVQEIEFPKTKREYQVKRKQVGEAVSRRLGNKPAQALSSYISPSVFDYWYWQGGWRPPGGVHEGVTEVESESEDVVV